MLLGCSVIPSVVHQPQFHNPYPQLSRVAVLPFFNQSDVPTVDGFKVAEIYQTELQKIPGFQVVPVGVVEAYLKESKLQLDSATDFRKVASDLGVDAVVVGSVTDFSPYYPPRLGLAIDWYAANEGFHPIPPGYGLPWGTQEEEFIPDSLVWEAEFALAKEQLATQTPKTKEENESEQAAESKELTPAQQRNLSMGLPKDWPNPKGFVPPGPKQERPVATASNKPIIEQVRQYDGADGDLTAKLDLYYRFRDDGRAGKWQGHLERSNDFMRFCCYLHITEMLAARGGAGETRLVFDRSDNR